MAETTGTVDAVVMTVAGAGKRSIQVRVSGLPEAVPTYATAGSAGADLRAQIPDTQNLHPGERTVIGTGICIELPEGYEGQVRPRSGLATKYGITVLNAPGTIDSDYRGEIRVPIINLGDSPFAIEPGMRIAQLVVSPVVHAEFSIDSGLSQTDRGAGGFGSSGLQ